MNNKTKVLIVDDSALIRLLLTEILNADPHIEVVGVAEDPYEARDKIKRTKPDVITLDVEMPKMDGLTFLANLMRLRPMPVVMISTLTEKGTDITLRALELGAIDFVCKPSTDVKDNLNNYAQEICTKVKAAAGARFIEQSATPSKLLASPTGQTRIQLIAIGASTGGTEAIKNVIADLPLGLPPIVVAQHIPDVFSTSYAKRLDSLTPLSVIEVREPLRLEKDTVYIAPGDDHLFVERQGSKLMCGIHHGDLVNRHRPSVDVLFNSVAEVVGKKAIGVILTGMGSDGAKGLLSMKKAGAVTYAQDEESSVVWGMPGQAVKLGAAIKQLPLDKVAPALVKGLS